ncbi:UDP-N-acetylglucosamine 2-epimerase [archaeon]|nr:UDP-N-acetylglucosamine 2-epimerase [archaeon]
MRKIVYVTGSRAEFGLMYSTLKAIDTNPKLDLHIIVTAMHLTKEHNSLKVVKNSGLKISKIIKPKVDLKRGGKNAAIFSGQLLIELTKVFEKIKPDIILIEADRFEQLSTAIAATHLNIPIAHISGGDVSKSMDDAVRHALTKMSHIHFPGTPKSAERIKKMGEEVWRVNMVGTPIFKDFATKEKIEKKLELDLSKETLLIIQHPINSQQNQAGNQMKETLRAIDSLNKQTIILYPSGDPGSNEIIKIIKKYGEKRNFHVFKNLEPAIFMGLLKNVSVMVGNSSAAIVEAPFFKLPSVNIGIREKDRERARNTIDSPHKEEKIKEAIQKALSQDFKKSLEKMHNPYNSDNVEKNICEVLENIELGERIINKEMVY